MREATRALVVLCAALGRRDKAALLEAMDRARDVAEPLAVEEALLQSYLFLGFPAALNAFKLWRRRSGRPAPPATKDDWAGWQERGAEVCSRVYAGQYERLRQTITLLHPDMERWMIAEGYGKVLGRPGLELRDRELCIVALLADQDAEPQLYAHLRGALNAGAAESDVMETVAGVGTHLGAERRAVLERTWEHVRSRRGR